MLGGVNTAIITPFCDGAIDWATYEALVERQLEAGVSGIVPCGTTGESSTLSDEEKLALIDRTVRQVAGRAAVIGGVGTNDTAQSVRLTRAARELGADAGLVITPYYNKPTQAGLYAHFAAIAKGAPGFPLVLYNVPGRTGVNLAVATADRLADLPEVVALKDATADLGGAAELVATCGDRLALLSGDDATAFPLWCVGGRGVISVTSNLAPKRMVALWSAFSRGDVAAARALHSALFPLFRALFIEANPVPVKAAIEWHTGLPTAEVRLPLTPLEEASVEALRGVCRRLGIGS